MKAPTALLFPGQGSQAPGMGRALAEAFPAARRVFEEADDTLSIPLSRLCWEGPEEELVLTANAQPALLTHSVAVLEVIRSELGGSAAFAGHSLGEFSAHVAAGSLSFPDALRLVRLRGESMARAGEARPGAMAAVLGLGDEETEEACREASQPGSTVVPANFNSEGQIVISGDRDAVERAMEGARARGARRAIPLRVSGAFHSPLMEPAQGPLREALDASAVGLPSAPVIANVTGASSGAEPAEIRRLLVTQLCAPVRWTACVRTLSAMGIERFLELGPGSVLTGLNRRNAPDARSVALGEPKDLEEVFG